MDIRIHSGRVKVIFLMLSMLFMDVFNSQMGVCLSIIDNEKIEPNKNKAK